MESPAGICGGNMLTKNDSEPSVQSIDRAIQVLQCFQKNEKLGLTEISKTLGLHKSTTYGNCVDPQEQRIPLKNEETGKVSAGIELYRIAAHVQIDLRDLCQPHIRQLCDTTGETINLVIRTAAISSSLRRGRANTPSGSAPASENRLPNVLYRRGESHPVLSPAR